MQLMFILFFPLQAASPDVAWGLSNPASEFCIKNGGKLEMRKGAAGEYGVRRLPDGREIEEWASTTELTMASGAKSFVSRWPGSKTARN
jgi:putative hemolysin